MAGTEVDPMDYAIPQDDTKAAAQDERKSRLNTLVAITVALIASLMGVCKVKDDNIVQSMQQAQADRIDQWNYYQARNIRIEIYRAAEDQMRLATSSAPIIERSSYRRQAALYAGMADAQERKREATRAQAEAAQKQYDTLNYRDDQFDLSDAALSLAVALLAITSLTQKRWLYLVALIPTLLGILMGLAGLLDWHIHPAMFTRLLT